MKKLFEQSKLLLPGLESWSSWWIPFAPGALTRSGYWRKLSWPSRLAVHGLLLWLSWKSDLNVARNESFHMVLLWHGTIVVDWAFSQNDIFLEYKYRTGTLVCRFQDYLVHYKSITLPYIIILHRFGFGRILNFYVHIYVLGQYVWSVIIDVMSHKFRAGLSCEFLWIRPAHCALYVLYKPSLWYAFFGNRAYCHSVTNSL